MRHYYTYFDKGYLIKGLALLNSLIERSSEPFTLHILCLDDATFEALKILNISTAKLYSISELEQTDHLLKQLKKYCNPESSKENRMRYSFAFSSWFTIYMLQNSGADEILYVDSDIYMFNDPELIFKDIHSKSEPSSVGLIRHRHISDFRSPFGFYNVGIMYFKNDETSLKVANWWLDAYVKQQPAHLATCGDQKFLEGFEAIIGKPPHEIESIGHGAPWNLHLYVYNQLNDGFIYWGKEKQPFVFMHFSKFSPDYENRTFSHTGGHYEMDTLGFASLKIAAVQSLYNMYFQVCFTIYRTLINKGIRGI